MPHFRLNNRDSNNFRHSSGFLGAAQTPFPLCGMALALPQQTNPCRVAQGHYQPGRCEIRREFAAHDYPIGVSEELLKKAKGTAMTTPVERDSLGPVTVPVGAG
jgi:hypothetical protein